MTIARDQQNILDLDHARVNLDKARAELEMMRARVNLVKAQAEAITSGKLQLCDICVEVVQRMNMDEPYFAPVRFPSEIPRCKAAPVLYSNDN